MKIAMTKSGYDVLTDTDPNHYIYNSDYNTFKYFAVAYTQLSLTTKQTDGIDYNVGPFETAEIKHRIRHGLGYYPVFDVLVSSSSDITRYFPQNCQDGMSYATGTILPGIVSAYATTQDIICYLHYYNNKSGSYVLLPSYTVYVRIYHNNIDI